MSSTKRTRTTRGTSVPRPRRAAGRVERAVEVGIRASRAGGKADKTRAPIEGIVRSAAQALDDAAGDPYAVAQLLGKVLDVFTLAGLVPQPVGAVDDTWAAFEKAMSTPEVGNTANPW